jgi:hypothetical protein
LFEYSNKEQQTVNLKNTDGITNIIPNPPILSKSLRMTVKQVFSAISVGGALNVYGVPCEVKS